MQELEGDWSRGGAGAAVRVPVGPAECARVQGPTGPTAWTACLDFAQHGLIASGLNKGLKCVPTERATEAGVASSFTAAMARFGRGIRLRYKHWGPTGRHSMGGDVAPGSFCEVQSAPARVQAPTSSCPHAALVRCLDFAQHVLIAVSFCVCRVP